ncbi:MAG: bifunctional demethylmenaquinone methyltransferase/2-methoxy-6-polyprenyl-1,4-benzoquinol methylase UbiE [Nitrospira sp.]|nr:bifunctional demethylmenaquinone methyltransferase/2-methoxy-6-polyprenyl-1,4-benzoquinol methylase UbiE [Nitrospira sp.]
MAKKDYLNNLFGGIHKRYDLLNHVLSFNRDKSWRKTLVDQAESHKVERVLDVCTGTCDLAMEFARRVPDVSVIGSDISDEMLRIGYWKIKKAGLNGRIKLQQSDLFYLPFKDNIFDAVSIGFGFRNLHDFRAGIREMVRVLKEGGLLLILELTLPKNRILKALHLFYLKNVLPRIGGLLSGSRDSYEYLSSSIIVFPKQDDVLEMLRAENLQEVSFRSLSGGVASFFMGKK